MQPGGGEGCLEVRSRQNKFIEGKEELKGKAIGSLMVSCSLSFCAIFNISPYNSSLMLLMICN